MKHSRDVEVLSVLTGIPQPTEDQLIAMGSAGVEAWLKRQWDVFMDEQHQGVASLKSNNDDAQLLTNRSVETLKE